MKNAYPEIAWRDCLCLGIPEIDDQHHHLVKIANLVLAAIHEGKAEAYVKKIVEMLRQYTKEHFLAEEDFMRGIGYPGLGEHRGEHMRLTHAVKQFQHTLYLKEQVPPEELRDLLKSWLLDHILQMDMAIAVWLRERSRQ